MADFDPDAYLAQTNTQSPMPAPSVDTSNFDPDAYLAQASTGTSPSPANQPVTQPTTQPTTQPADTSNFDPDAYLNQLDQQKYGSTGQKVLGAAEKFAQGAIGPFAPLLEHIAGVKYADIAGRERTASPIVSTIAETSGFLGGMITGSSAATAVSKIGEATAGLSGLGHVIEAEKLASKAGELGSLARKAASTGATNAGSLLKEATQAKSISDIANKGISLGSKLASGAVRGGAEMAALQGSNELSKMIIDQPNASAETALAHVGLAAAIGAPIGMAFNAISPIWKATVGDRLAPILEDAKSRLKFHLDNPNIVDAAKEELQNLHSNVSDTIDKLYSEGNGGIRGEQLAGSMPEVSPNATAKINEHMQDANDLVEKTIKNMGDDVKTRSRIPYLQQDLNKFQEIVTNPDATYINKFNALDDLKKSMQGYSRYGASVEDTAFGALTKTLGAKIRPMLENPEVWGKAGGIQEDVNKAISEFLPAQKDIRSRFMTQMGGDKVIDPSKMNTYINQLGKPQAEIKQDMVKSYLNKSSNLIDTVNGLFTSKGLDAPFAHTSQAILRDTIGEKTAGAQLIDKVIRDNLKGFLGKSAGALVGGVAGAKLGSPGLGAILGENLFGSLFKTVLPGLSGPLLENPSSVSGLKSAIDYSTAVFKGDKALNQAVKGVFSGSGKMITASTVSNQQDRDKIDRIVAGNMKAPIQLMQQQGGNLGHYLPGHQTAMTQATMQTIKYLQGLKPFPQKLSPLDKPIPPTQAQITRYNRALEIAQNPILVLDKAYKGTLQIQDVQDLSAMYPTYHQQIAQKITKAMTSNEAEGNHVYYETRMGLSLLMGQALDSTMTPNSIQSAQAALQPIQALQAPTPGKKPSKEAGKGLQKGAAAYQTSTQAAEKDRSGRE